MRYKYCLIVSQYYHSYHTFIVEVKDDFQAKALKMIEDLEKYKRYTDIDEKYNYGDFILFDINDMSSRYNINDYGDIYFINGNYINALTDKVVDIRMTYKKNGYIKNEVKEKIAEHHNSNIIMGIVEKYFEVI